MKARRSFKTLTMSLALATGAALMTALPASSATTAPANAQPLPSAVQTHASGPKFQLTSSSQKAAADKLLADHLTTRANLSDVLTNQQFPNSAGVTEDWMKLREMRSCAGKERGALPPDPINKVVDWCWQKSHGDDVTTDWFPQGMSTTGTADGADGQIQGRSAVAVAWHYENKPKQNEPVGTGCQTHNLLKLSFIDRETKKYRHVLLAEPTVSGTDSNFKFVTGHGGGIVWYGNYIYVTDTIRGLRVFDINKMAKVDSYGEGVSTYGVNGGKSSACGYGYVLPQVHFYSQPSCTSGTGDRTVAPTEPICHSWLSLDKTSGKPYKLVSGEYHMGPGGRVVRYQLNDFGAATHPGLLNLSGNKTVVEDAYTLSGYTNVQGGMTWSEGTAPLNFALQKSCSNVPNVFAKTWVGDTRATRTTGCTGAPLTPGGPRVQKGNWSAGTVEALSHWPKRHIDGANVEVNELWGLTEGVCTGTPTPKTDEPFDVCTGESGSPRLSLRAIYAVGFGDPLVQGLH